MTFDVETIGAAGAAITAFVTVLVAAWARLSPIITELVGLIRQSADAVGARPDVTSVSTQVAQLNDAMRAHFDLARTREAQLSDEMRVHFGLADARLLRLETRVSQLSCQACSVDAEDEPTPPTASIPTGQA